MTRPLHHGLLRALGLDPAHHPLIERARRLRRTLDRRDVRLRATYLSAAVQPKLQIGGGENRLEGWLNTDLSPRTPDVMLMDAARPFPFADGTFDCIYTEHMIEHVSYEEGALMLRECHRVLRPGGVIRIVTPDLVASLGLYGDAPTAIQQRYLSWFYDTFLPPDQPRTPAAVVNAMFRQWGHQFIYDEMVLADAMRAAGFGSVVKHPLGESDHPELKNLENTGRYPDGLLDFESLALEGARI
ncbi:MAG: methyltransferase domain-containing protein [Phenylobacterium sp.]